MASDAASSPHEDVIIAVIDVRRSYAYAQAKRDLYVALPPEDWQEGDEEMCGKLNLSLHGTRDTAQTWEEELGSTLGEAGLQVGVASPCLYNISKKDVSAAVHGDDVPI